MKQKNIEEIKHKRKREAVISVVMFFVLQLIIAGVFVGLCLIPELPGWCVYLFLGLAIACVVAVIPVFMLLKQRFREIEGGELDAASQY